MNTGELPAALGELELLQVVNLRGNRLRGEGVERRAPGVCRGRAV